MSESSLMHPFGERFFLLVSRVAIATLCVLAFSSQGQAQSTFGTVLGTVTDPSGSVIPKARIELINTGTNNIRAAESNESGNYQFNNIDVGTYRIMVEAPGFQKTEYQAFDLTARETKRVDINPQVASQASTVQVQATVPIVQTDVSNISESKGSRELTDLPVAIATRSAGSTSAFSTLTAQPGVQTDASNNIIVAGALPDMLSITIDGISNVKLGYNPGTTELFPSFYSIEEIKISETLNPAEFGGVADITTVSKSGTNSFHGGLFENFQNTDLNAADTFSHQVTPVKLNNFGAYLGGPVILPKYNGRNKTFFFGSYEVLRLPKSSQAVLSVPTQAMRNGDLTAYDGTIVPQTKISPFARKLLDYFYPLPNYGPPGAIANNFLTLYSLPINSAQGDLRLDHVISPKHLVYARYTYKNRRVTTAPQSPLLGTVSRPAIYNAFTAAHNWVISPSLVNEARVGSNRSHFDVNIPRTSAETAAALGLTSPPLPAAIPTGSLSPTLRVAGYGSFYGGLSGDQNPKQTNLQITDALTWTKGKHTMKFGGDFRYVQSLFTQVFGCCRLGNYTFDGSANLGFSPFSGFLQGFPDNTQIVSVLNPNADSYSRHYDVFTQDDWKVSRSLTINFGLRWEYNPGFHDRLGNIANWYPNYTSIVDGRTVRGAVIIPNQAAFASVNPLFVQTIDGTPVLVASQVGVPETLSANSKKDFAPRVGFAYRLGGSNKTVIRGGYGRFIEVLQGVRAGHGWGTASSAYGYFANSLGSNGKPVFSMPYSYPANTAQPGSLYYSEAVVTNYKDPIVEEWNLTLERDLGKSVGVRASYDGNHSYNVPTLANLNQIRTNTLGFFDPRSQAAQPFPQVAYIVTGTNQAFGNYQAGTISVRKRSSSLQFEGSYAFTRNLSNVIGPASVQGNAGSSNFPSEFGQILSDLYNPGLDYGNIPFSRRHRFLATFLYELPFGRAKSFLNSVNPVVDRIVGGFSLSGILVFQSGPFMTITTLHDPSGTGFNIFNANGGRADTVKGVDPYQGQSLDQWINPAAFADPADNIGRYGNSQQGAVQGPATKAVAISLLKRVAFTEGTRLEIGAQISNLFNHPNYATPSNLTLGVPAFAAITSLQIAEGAGPRQIQLTGRFIF